MFSKVLDILQVVLSVILIIAVLIQQKGSGLGAAFGGSSNIYSTKRGIDKTLFQITIAVSILFLAISIVNLIV